ncbi:protein SMAX1-LIKE 3-like protein [Cinnamomum micranthum f. kanehirae]|uniref:Protein SMAX1-LIKE 3-like protein n=1 Tax=Cinnamomum micranthum f. kanehirae TaxID=337451 RepID=A0A3S3NKS6_9MAGN|nr:protein SMAX1-LIKE 3-like protein [Cinnamomum micranthum f. kanehirae]
MRAGGCTVQQALTPEAATVVKQAVSLARRRGHAQVTPLHVANTMLASSTGLFRTACLQSHSHPLQCKALELCFNVALNRLPASTSSPMLGPHSHHPSLSNALVAAFKRAQAHQRRGSIENQQQPLLAVKIEIEQLIISILDDPSVSRVMREAGFSSTQVKSNVEQAVSLEICAPSPPINKSKEGNLLMLGGSAVSSSPSPLGPFGMGVSKARPLDQVRSEDVMCVVENMVDRRRSTVIVGECLASCEGVVRGVMEKVGKREAPEALRNVQFISLPPSSFGHLSRGEVEQKLGDIKCLVKGCAGRGVVLYFGDLKWAADYRANTSEQGRNYCCPIDQMILELGRLVCGMGESGRLWLLGIGTYQTYMRCRVGHPSLETVWGLHPLTIPAGSLGLSLTLDSDLQGQLRNNRNGGEFHGSSVMDGLEKQLTCCTDCASKFENEARSLANSSSHHDSSSTITSSLPSWLQQYKEENKRLTGNEQDCVQVRQLCKKWNSICNSVHKDRRQLDRSLSFPPIYPSSSISSYEPRCASSQHQAWPNVFAAKQWKENHFWISDDASPETSMRVYFPDSKETRLALLHNPNPNPNSASSSDTMEMECLQRFKEINAENLKTMCKALEEKVSWHKDIIPEISSTILKCRSGMTRRKGSLALNETKEDTWLFFQGGDTMSKEKIARELAFLVFGSHTNFISIGLSSFSSTRSDSTDDIRSKRSRAESSCGYLERFADAIGSNPHCVFFLEDIEQIDCFSHMGFKNAIERGSIRNINGDEIRLQDAIIIFSCESFDARSRASSRAASPPIKQKLETQEEEDIECDNEISPCVSLDLNLSFDDMDDLSFDDTGLLGLVDGRFVFRSSDM